MRINTITAAAVGDWETVIYEKQWYPGIIKKSINIALYVKFLAKKEKKDYFYWPKTTDIKVPLREQMLCVIY